MKFPPRGRWQFSWGSLMLFVTHFAVLMSALGGMLRIQSGEKTALPRSFLMMAIAAPTGLVIITGIILSFKVWLARRKNVIVAPTKGRYAE